MLALKEIQLLATENFKFELEDGATQHTRQPVPQYVGQVFFHCTCFANKGERLQTLLLQGFFFEETLTAVAHFAADMKRELGRAIALKCWTPHS